MALLFVADSQIIGRKIRPEDLRGCEYDTVRLGYWVRTDSPTYSLLALKGCEFGRKWGQTAW
jgi:hypothetical protein